MDILKELIIINKAISVPVYLQISSSFTESILQGKLRKGLKLPGSREVAHLLNINRMTMVAAYNELEAQGWIEKIERKGTFVKSDLPVLMPKRIHSPFKAFAEPVKPSFQYNEKKIIPIPSSDFPVSGNLYFNDGFPDPRIAPVNELMRNMRSLFKQAAGKRYLMYGDAQGTLFLREALAAYLNDTRGLSITKENILVTKGAQMGIYLSTYVLINPGDHVIVGNPGYTGANLTFQQLGATLNYVPVDDDGLNIDEVEKICGRKKIKMVYVIPHHHNPTTVTLTPERRIRLLKLATRYRFAIIEDDYDYDFHYTGKPIMPMASLDSKGNIIYIGTMAKILAPAIRLGFVVAPESFIKTATYLRKSIDTQGDSLMENAIAAMFKDGTLARHRKKSVKLYRERRDYFCKLLESELGEHISFKIPEGGMSVWVNFLQADLSVVSRKAAREGLIMNDGRNYNTVKGNHNSVRLGFASLNLREQEKAVAILKKILNA